MYFNKHPFIADKAKLLPTMIMKLLPKLSSEYITNMKLYCNQQLRNQCYNMLLDDDDNDDNNNNKNNTDNNNKKRTENIVIILKNVIV